MLPLTGEEIASYNNQEFCHVSGKKSNDSNGEEFGVKKFHGDDDYYDHGYDSDDEEFDVRNFHEDAADFLMLVIISMIMMIIEMMRKLASEIFMEMQQTS